MRYSYADEYTLELPPGHRFPMEKYRRCRELLTGEGTICASQIRLPELCPREVLERVHTREWVERVFTGSLTPAEVRSIGFPWSEALVRRSRCSVAGTVAAAACALDDGAGGNFAGGTHHAFADRGEGFCVFNDVAVAVRHLQATGRISRAAVVDLDVHQGNGTAAIFARDASVFTLSVHGEHNWPFHKERSDLDIALRDGCEDAEYLERVHGALRVAFETGPDIVFFVAGVDPFVDDRLGRLALTLDGLRARDVLVLGESRKRGVPVATVFGGGYADSVDDIVEAHANTFRVAEAFFPR